MSGTRGRSSPIPADKDPVLRAGDVLPELRVRFWDFLSAPLLRRFIEIAARGDFGEIDSISGTGRDDRGRTYSFHWKRGGRACVRASGQPGNSAGGLRLTGRLDFTTVNRIRNFPLFHLRPEFRYVD
jgi:hypothetical protein